MTNEPSSGSDVFSTPSIGLPPLQAATKHAAPARTPHGQAPTKFVFCIRHLTTKPHHQFSLPTGYVASRFENRKRSRSSRVPIRAPLWAILESLRSTPSAVSLMASAETRALAVIR